MASAGDQSREPAKTKVEAEIDEELNELLDSMTHL